MKATAGLRASRTAMAAALVASTMLSACAPGAGQGQRVIVADPAPDGTSCYSSSRVPFYQLANRALVADQDRENANKTNQAIAAGGALVSVAGFAAGGRAGNIIGGLGALTAVVGALNSNVQTDQRFIADVSSGFSGLVQCRQAEAAQVRLDVRSGKLTRPQGRVRLQTLHDLMVDDGNVALRVNYALARRNQTYGVEIANVDTRIANDPAERQRRAPEVAQARQTIQSNQRALTDQVVAINRAAGTITVSSNEHAPQLVREG